MAVLALIVLGLALFGSGCATAPSGSAGSGAITGQPSTLLAGAGLEDARSVAMAAARSKGWTLVSVGQSSPHRSSPNPSSSNLSLTEQSEPREQSLILERNISAASPQAVALGALPSGAPPKVRVDVTLVASEAGTEVGLRAFVIVNPGAESEKLIDYTQDYAEDLAVSLSALQSAWLATGHRLASPAPVPEAPAEPAPDDIADPDAASASVTAPLATASVSPSPEAESGAAESTGTWAAEAASSEATASTQPAERRDAGRGGAPVVDAGANPATGLSNPMLALNTEVRAGTWSYYAERFAAQQGCELTDQGAVLLRKTPSFELHEIDCGNGGNLLLKCQDGICQRMR